MTDQQIKRLVIKFRKAIDAAQNDRRFDKDIFFKNFPSGCCGDTSDLSFEFIQAHDFDGLKMERLRKLYSIIEQYKEA